jgi:hypothetical protein
MIEKLVFKKIGLVSKIEAGQWSQKRDCATNKSVFS